MPKIEKHIQYLFAAELQFRLTSAVHLATTLNRQPLDLPTEWTHGKHRVFYEEIALRNDQADYAAFLLHRSATYTIAVAIKDAIEEVATGLPRAVKSANEDILSAIRRVIQEVERKPWSCSDDDTIAAYHIARLIRNAYAHAPFAPKWMVHSGLRDMIFAIPDVIQLDTQGLHGTPFDWRHYGGPLAMFRFCRFVRFNILGDQSVSRKDVPGPDNMIYQQGNLILQKTDEIPTDSEPIDIEPQPDGGIPLGGGHVLYPGGKRQEDDE